jgi:hypothetical protein
MRNRDYRLIDSVLRSALFAEQYAEQFPGLRKLGSKLAKHADRLAVLRDQDIVSRRSQGASGEELRRRRNELRLKHLIPMARAGKKLFRFAPGIERAVQAPGSRATATEVVRASRAMCKAVKPHRKLFLDIGFDRRFLEDCTRMTDDLDRRALSWDSERKKKTALLKSITEEVRIARGTMDVMDAMMVAQGGRDSGPRTAWLASKKVGRKVGRPRKKRRPVTPAAPATA